MKVINRGMTIQETFMQIMLPECTKLFQTQEAVATQILLLGRIRNRAPLKSHSKTQRRKV